MYLIKNGTVHIGNGEVIENCDVLTEGKLIRKVGCHLQIGRASCRERV